MSFISSKPVLLDTIFPYKVTRPVLNLYPDYNVFQRNCKIIPLKPCIRLLLNTGKEIGHFSLFTWITALICVSHKMNLDKSQALCLAYMEIPALPPTYNSSVSCFVPTPPQVLSYSSYLLGQLSIEKTYTFL